jgi:hypothetical protein
VLWLAECYCWQTSCGEYRANDHADTIRAMADLPSGEWSQLLVGHQWPDAATLSILSAAATQRATLGVAYDGYADILNSVRTGTLASQEGVTADSAHRSFRLGEIKARDIAVRNLAKRASYTSAHQWVTDLRADLEVIATSGNSAIRRILDSDDPAPLKISALVQTVTEAQQHANARAAACCANVCDGIQTILTTGDAQTSARALARSHGVELEHAFGSPNPEHIRAVVSAMMATPSPGSAPAVAVMAPVGTTPSPESLANSFTDGTYAGAPLAVGAEALTSGAVNALHTAQRDPAAEPLAASQTTVVAAPSTESTGAVAPPGVATATAEPTQAVVVSIPASPGSVSATASTPVTPPGALPRYGADLRSSLKSEPPPAAVSSKGAPASAPVAAAGAPALAHSSVVRQQPTAMLANAVTATTIGALAGAGITRSTAVSRLRRLLDSVARQQPVLRWGIGDREDGSTVLATDLASGWIPPHIDIPVGVQLLEPGRRDTDLVTLLSEATMTETYEPGRDAISAEQGDEVPMSVRAHHTTAVKDLGWELTQATRWRDGLPRLAYTLARASVARTGFPDAEIALLRTELDAVATEVLVSYPDTVSPAAIGNWQLLATIEALVGTEMTLANYHFAWFHAHER